MRALIIASIADLVLPALSEMACAEPDVSGKVVLANLDRFDAYLRVGTTRREIKPRKAQF